MLKLERVFYPQIQSLIEVKEKASINIENNFSLSVNYDLDDKRCIGTLEIRSVCKEHEDWFSVDIKVVGVFTSEKIESDDDVKQAHVEAYDTLFPYVQSLLSDLTTKGGLLPFMLEKAPLDFSRVKLNKK